MYLNRSKTIKKKLGRPRQLSERKIRVFKKYAILNCYVRFNIIVAKFSAITKFKNRESTGRRF